MFAKGYHGEAGPVLTRMAREADIPYADTWDRSGDVKRHRFQEQIIADLAERGLRYFTVSGTLESRLLQVDAILRGFRKYGNVGA
jgi:nicotinamide riboside kinase